MTRKSEDRVVEYQCTKCKAVDRVFLFSNEAAPPIINCWNCHAGFGQPHVEQMQRRNGMVPVEPTALSMIAQSVEA